MKNSFGLIFIVFTLLVLGCACPNLNKFNFDKKGTTSTPLPTNSTNTEIPSSSPKSNKDYSISLAKYNQVKNGMTYQEAVNIIGGEGTEVSSSEVGKYKTATYKWDGENYSYIILTFQNDKLMFKTQGSLK